MLCCGLGPEFLLNTGFIHLVLATQAACQPPRSLPHPHTPALSLSHRTTSRGHPDPYRRDVNSSCSSSLLHLSFLLTYSDAPPACSEPAFLCVRFGALCLSATCKPCTPLLFTAVLIIVPLTHQALTKLMTHANHATQLLNAANTSGPRKL